MNPRERREQPPFKDLDKDLVVAYAATFIARDDIYPLQLENGRYISLQRQLYPELVAAHLKGFVTIGCEGRLAHPHSAEQLETSPIVAKPTVK